MVGEMSGQKEALRGAAEQLVKINGRVGKTEDEVVDLKIKMAESRGRESLASALWGLAGGGALAVVAALLRTVWK